MITFASLMLCEPILRALTDEGYTTPTPIQAQTIQPALEGRDILGCAQTGTGKTAAFALPIIHMLHTQGVDKSRRGRRGPRALVLSPTRELATQIAESFGTYCRYTGIRGTAIYGGVSQRRQEQALSRGVDVVVATPGRLIDLLDQGVIDLSEVQIFALDEADRMLDMGFIQPIRRIAEEIQQDGRQTLLFSATMPRKVESLADTLLHQPVKISVARSKEEDPQIEQTLYRVQRNDKQALLEHLIRHHSVTCGVVFAKTKHGAERIGNRLNMAGFRADAIHGNKSQAHRQRALDSLRSGRSHILVATDVAARGLDVDGVSHVFNFDLPIEPEAYIHRIGRTARAGATGQAIAFCSPDERNLLRSIESMLGKKIQIVEQPAEGLPRAAEYHDEDSRRSSSRETPRRDGFGRDSSNRDTPRREFQPARKPATTRSVAPAAGFSEPRMQPAPAATVRPVQTFLEDEQVNVGDESVTRSYRTRPGSKPAAKSGGKAGYKPAGGKPTGKPAGKPGVKTASKPGSKPAPRAADQAGGFKPKAAKAPGTGRGHPLAGGSGSGGQSSFGARPSAKRAPKRSGKPTFGGAGKSKGGSGPKSRAPGRGSVASKA